MYFDCTTHRLCHIFFRISVCGFKFSKILSCLIFGLSCSATPPPFDRIICVDADAITEKTGLGIPPVATHSQAYLRLNQMGLCTNIWREGNLLSWFNRPCFLETYSRSSDLYMITFWQFNLMIGYKVEKHRNEGIKFTWKMPRVVAHFTRKLLDARPFNHLKARMEEEEVKWATIIAVHQILPRFKLFHLKASPFPLKIQQLQNNFPLKQ